MIHKNYLAALLCLLLMQAACRNASFKNVDTDEAASSETGGSGDAAPAIGDESPDLGKAEAPYSSDAAPEPTGSADAIPDSTNIPPADAAMIPSPTPEDANAGDTKGGGKGSGKGDGGGKGVPPVPVKILLDVSLNSPEVKAGGTIQASAKIRDGMANPPVKWSIMGPVGLTDIGTIDEMGVYKSPAKIAKAFPLVIIATLLADPAVFGTAPLVVLPNEEIFARCTRGNEVFPILAHVYKMTGDLTRVPDFSNSNEVQKVLTVCMDKYAVAPRNFKDGFPDVPELVENFALQTTTVIKIPVDGEYHFQLNSDDGAILRIDGKLIIDNDGIHQAVGPDPQDSEDIGRKQARVTLKKGEYPLTLNYFQGPKYRIALELKWRTPMNSKFVYIPTQSFK